MQTPLERLLGETPDYTFFKVFGCVCWPYIRPYNNHKLQFHSKPCVFLGYSSLHKGYKCLHIPTNRTYISRDVVFDETVFPFTQTSSNSTLPSSSTSPLNPGQFVDAAYTPLLLANHGAGRGARLELLDDQPGDSSTDYEADANHITISDVNVHGTASPHASGVNGGPTTITEQSHSAASPGSCSSTTERALDVLDSRATRDALDARDASDAPDVRDASDTPDARDISPSHDASPSSANFQVPPSSQPGVTTRFQRGICNPKKMYRWHYCLDYNMYF
jgi:hypothetical protein